LLRWYNIDACCWKLSFFTRNTKFWWLDKQIHFFPPYDFSIADAMISIHQNLLLLMMVSAFLRAWFNEKHMKIAVKKYKFYSYSAMLIIYKK
jgi:S-adenosylmethionine:tRNA-ribosyltransferase-isomerase (queuine synthetase)